VEVRRDKVHHQSNAHSMEEIGLEDCLPRATVQLDNRAPPSIIRVAIESERSKFILGHRVRSLQRAFSGVVTGSIAFSEASSILFSVRCRPPF
jgi:hypothetical protein